MAHPQCTVQLSTNLNPPEKKSGRLRHCPATYLVPRAQGEASPLRDSSAFSQFSSSQFSSDHYQGYFHTDHLIPSAFFRPERGPKTLEHYEDLSLRYLFDSAGDPEDHAELMTGVKATSRTTRNSGRPSPLATTVLRSNLRDAGINLDIGCDPALIGQLTLPVFPKCHQMVTRDEFLCQPELFSGGQFPSRLRIASYS